MLTRSLSLHKLLNGVPQLLIIASCKDLKVAVILITVIWSLMLYNDFQQTVHLLTLFQLSTSLLCSFSCPSNQRLLFFYWKYKPDCDQQDNQMIFLVWRLHSRWMFPDLLFLINDAIFLVMYMCRTRPYSGISRVKLDELQHVKWPIVQFCC